MSRKVTLVWDYHGGGHLVGVFDDPETIKRLRARVAESDEEPYVRFTEVTLNEVSTSLSSPPETSMNGPSDRVSMAARALVIGIALVAAFVLVAALVLATHR